ncbi:MAG TPA: hypothetical protein VMD07_03050 [Candidatus Acidoferrales bacterium]|nr:hypothetical protein [Candidatus Acidoferrales bacterium]
MRALAALLVLSIAMLASIAPGGAQPVARPVVWLDAAPLDTLAIERSGKAPLVALSPLAHALDWKIVRNSGTAVLSGHDRVVTLTIGLRTVVEDGDPHAMFEEPPLDRNGQIYLSAPDAAKLFGLSLSTSTKLVFHRPQILSSDTEITEIPESPTPHPTATPRVNRNNNNGGDGATANAGRVLLSLDRTGSANVLNIQSETNGSFLATRLDSSGVNQVGPPDATVIVGNAQRNASIGYISDPIAGLIFGGGVYEGVDLHNGESGHDEFIGRRLDDGYSSFGTVLSDPRDGTSDTLDVLMNGTSYAEMLLRRFAVWHEPWGDYSREFIIGSRGFGMGFGARTRGRTFLETTVTYASRTLPLGPNDAPIRVDVGRELSDATTVTAGFEETPLTPFGPYVGISTHSQNFVAGISATNHEISGSLDYHTTNADVQGYTVPGISRASGLEGTYYFPAVTIDAQSINELGDAESFIEARTNRPGLNLVTGVGFPSGGKAGPIVGLSIPVSRMLSVEGTLRPSASGPYRLHLGIAASIGRRRTSGEPMVPANVRLEGAPAHAVRVFVDGTPAGTRNTASFTVRVTKGTHTFSAESLDGSEGTPDTSVTVEAAGDTVALPLYPEQAVKGHVTLAPTAIVPSDFSLAGITVLIEPGDIAVETNADGTFFFPRQPIPEDATVSIDPATLPRELQAGPVRSLSDDVELAILPGIPIERRAFPPR